MAIEHPIGTRPSEPLHAQIGRLQVVFAAGRVARIGVLMTPLAAIGQFSALDNGPDAEPIFCHRAIPYPSFGQPRFKPIAIEFSIRCASGLPDPGSAIRPEQTGNFVRVGRRSRTQGRLAQNQIEQQPRVGKCLGGRSVHDNPVPIQTRRRQGRSR